MIETVVVYKFPQLSREVIEQMLGISELRQTRVFQEALLDFELLADLDAWLADQG
nr:Rpn family recombination-promoting nuclease/putative transposase [Petrachloros mirabilis]